MNISEYYNSLDDALLLELLNKGDKRAFDQIYNRYFSLLYKYAFRILKDKEECCDAIQDLFIWLWENKNKLQIECLKNYLLASVKFKLVRAIQTSKRHSEIIAENYRQPDNLSAYSDTVEIKDLKKVIDDIITLMPGRAGEILTLSRREYLSNKEIAYKLHITEKTVENHLTISLRRLRSELGKLFSLFFL